MKTDTARIGLLHYTLPLAVGGRRAYLDLPNDLTCAEAERLAAFITAVAQPAVGGGSRVAQTAKDTNQSNAHIREASEGVPR